MYVPELLYYDELTNGKTRIVAESIMEGYLFVSKNIFKNYIKFKIRSRVIKTPQYPIKRIHQDFTN